MSESADRAKLTVAYEGLCYLVETKSTLPDVGRKELFQCLKADARNPDIVKAIRSRGWQKPYVDRLVGVQALRKTTEDSQDRYSVLDLKMLLSIIDDYKSGTKEKLSLLVFPPAGIDLVSLKGMLNGVMAESEEEGEEEAYDPPDDSVPEDEEVPDLKGDDPVYDLLGRLLDQLIGMSKSISERLVKLERNMDGLRADVMVIRSDTDMIPEGLQEISSRSKSDTKTIQDLTSAVSGAVRAMRETENEIRAKATEPTPDYQKELQELLEAVRKYSSRCEQLIEINQKVHAGRLNTAVATVKAAMDLMVEALEAQDDTGKS